MIDAKDIKQVLIEALDHFDKFYGEGSTSQLRKTVSTVSDAGTLYRMLQTFREALGIEDTSFKISLPDGKIKVFKNLKEMDDHFRSQHA